MKIQEITENYPLSLLLDADPDIKKIEKYLNKGHCYAAFDGSEIVGEYVLKENKDKTAEIMNVAVLPARQKQGIGRLLVKDAIARAAQNGIETLFVGTGLDSYQQKFYESCGFTLFRIDEGYFTREYDEPIEENGTRLIDLAVLRQDIG